MTAKKDYVVGRGKPPIHTRFPKGQSGNPSGRPKKSTRAQLHETLKAALKLKPDFLSTSRPGNTLASIVKALSVAGMRGDVRAIKLLVTLVEASEPHEPVGAGAASRQPAPDETSKEDQTRALSLPQGKNQGSSENTPAENATIVTEQDVGAADAAEAGKLAAMETASAVEALPAEQPNQPPKWDSETARPMS